MGGGIFTRGVSSSSESWFKSESGRDTSWCVPSQGLLEPMSAARVGLQAGIMEHIYQIS